MKSTTFSKHKPSILGITTVNDKGQVVIPAEARTAIDLQPGDKLLAMIHPSREGVVLLKPDGLESYAKQMLEQLSSAKESFKEDSASNV